MTVHIVIPKSSNSARVADSSALVDFELGDDKLAAIDVLDVGNRPGEHPDHYAELT